MSFTDTHPHGDGGVEIGARNVAVPRRGGRARQSIDAFPLVHQQLRLRLGRTVDSGIDRAEDATAIVGDIGVPEPEDTVALSLKPPRALGIPIGVFLLAVMRAVDFYDQFRGHACDVHHVGTNRHLTTEMSSGERQLSQGIPQLALGFRLLGAQALRRRLTEGMH